MGVDGCCEGSTVALTTDQTQMQVERASRPDLLHYCIGFPAGAQPHHLQAVVAVGKRRWNKGVEMETPQTFIKVSNRIPVLARSQYSLWWVSQQVFSC